MRRRTKPRVVWLPPTNANSISADNLSGFQAFRVDISPDAPMAVGEIPLVIDSQDDPLDPTTSLADVESSGYRLRRIVGKIWISIDQDAGTPTSKVFCTAGLIIRRSKPEDGQSYARATLDASLISPEQIKNYGDPWIWRRSWLLGNNLGGAGGGTDPILEETNFQNTSALDGPHVDQKTARIVGPEERLFLDVSFRGNVEDPQDQSVLSCLVNCDLRVLASMRTSSGNRRNASR